MQSLLNQGRSQRPHERGGNDEHSELFHPDMDLVLAGLDLYFQLGERIHQLIQSVGLQVLHVHIDALVLQGLVDAVGGLRGDEGRQLHAGTR